MNYNVDYFIKKFEAIPENKWCVRVLHYNDKFCALGYCNCIDEITGWYKDTNEGNALAKILRPYAIGLDSGIQKEEGCSFVTSINDGSEYFIHLGDTPKKRLLAALYDTKACEDAVKETQQILKTQTQFQTI